MALAALKTFIAGEVLTASDLNSLNTNILNNAADLVSPFTKAISMGGFALNFDAANTMSLTSSTRGLNLSTTTAINDTFTTVASAATPDIWTGTGHLIDYTGTVTATGFAAAPQAGATRTLVCAAAAPFTAGANMLIDGFASGTTFTAVTGDVVEIIAVTTTQFRLKPRLYTNASIFCDISTCDFRLTLTAGTSVTTADVTGATTIYCSPYKGNRITLFDGTSWNVRISAEFSLALGTLTSGLPYDVFCYDNAGVPTLEFLAWTNGTTRATALALQNGVLSKTGALTRRYLGTFYTTSTTATEDSAAKRFLWNYYNRLRRAMQVNEGTNSWTYTTATIRQANAVAGNQLDFVRGLDEDAVTADLLVVARNSAAAVNMHAGIGLDSTTAFSGQRGLVVSPAASYEVIISAQYRGLPGLGRHFLSWNEYSVATGTTTWFGDDGGTLIQSGIAGEVSG